MVDCTWHIYTRKGGLSSRSFLVGTSVHSIQIIQPVKGKKDILQSRTHRKHKSYHSTSPLWVVISGDAFIYNCFCEDRPTTAGRLAKASINHEPDTTPAYERGVVQRIDVCIENKAAPEERSCSLSSCISLYESLHAPASLGKLCSCCTIGKGAIFQVIWTLIVTQCFRRLQITRKEAVIFRQLLFVILYALLYSLYASRLASYCRALTHIPASQSGSQSIPLVFTYCKSGMICSPHSMRGIQMPLSCEIR